jgi:type IV pilus assembly protein PilP
VKRFPLCLLACAALLLAGCEGSKDEELRSWTAEQRAQTRPRVTPLTEPKQYVPQDYTGQAGMDPFSLDKLTRAMQSDTSRVAANAALIAPELSRRKEPLESFPLDTMAMVGSLTRGNQPVALLRVGAMLYQVRVGEHLGQNFGKVTGITENELKLREIVQDATGDWTERETGMQLQESSK